MIALTASKISRILSFTLIERFVYERYGLYFTEGPIALAPEGQPPYLVKHGQVDSSQWHAEIRAGALNVHVILHVPMLRVVSRRDFHTLEKQEKLWWFRAFKYLCRRDYSGHWMGIKPRVRVSVEQNVRQLLPHPGNLRVAITLPEKMTLAVGPLRIDHRRIVLAPEFETPIGQLPAIVFPPAALEELEIAGLHFVRDLNDGPPTATNVLVNSHDA